MFKRTIVLTLLVLAAGCSSAPDDATSPYAGEQTRALKALSAQEVEGYLSGEGMGLAKAAELNHYPGPKHALALADELELTDAQRTRIERIFERMQAEAIRLGERIVEKEGTLDALFAAGEAEPGRTRSLVRELGALQADLRFTHLEAHLKMKDLLTEQQVHHYDQLRGYDASAPPGQQHPGHQH
jgi:Spy/CpxP family protein refolding chaperone